MLPILNAFLGPPPERRPRPDIDDDDCDERNWIVHRAAIADRERALAFLKAWDDAAECVEVERQRRFPDGWVPSMAPHLDPRSRLHALGHFFRPPRPRRRDLDPRSVEQLGAGPLREFWNAYGPSMLLARAGWTVTASKDDVQGAVDDLAAHIDASPAPAAEDGDQPLARLALAHLQKLLLNAEDGVIAVRSLPWVEFQRVRALRLKRLVQLDAPWSAIAEVYDRIVGLCEYMDPKRPDRGVSDAIESELFAEPVLTRHTLLTACFDGLERAPLGLGEGWLLPQHDGLVPRVLFFQEDSVCVLIDDELREYAEGIAALRPKDLSGFGVSAGRLHSLLERYHQLAADGGALVVEAFVEWSDE